MILQNDDTSNAFMVHVSMSGKEMCF